VSGSDSVGEQQKTGHNHVGAESYAVSYSKSGVRKLLAELGWSYQRGRKLYIWRSVEEQARFVLETEEALAEFAESGAVVVPLAGEREQGLSGGNTLQTVEPSWAATLSCR